MAPGESAAAGAATYLAFVQRGGVAALVSTAIDMAGDERGNAGGVIVASCARRALAANNVFLIHQPSCGRAWRLVKRSGRKATWWRAA